MGALGLGFGFELMLRAGTVWQGYTFVFKKKTATVRSIAFCVGFNKWDSRRFGSD